MLALHDLRIAFGATAQTNVVDGVSLAVPAGQTVALVGESGCGKSVTSLAILRLVPPPGRITAGRIEFDGRDLLGLSEREMRSIRGARIGMVFQEPMTSLNPVLAVGEQIAEPLIVHNNVRPREAERRAVDLLRRVGISSPESRARDYPHQMSGGMRQRVMIAMAIACEPALLIADEPTTALDVTIQRQILDLLRELQRQTGMGLLFITHDLPLVAELADEVNVMYAGRIVEHAPTAALFAAPRHPYTQALRRSVPSVERSPSAASGGACGGQSPSAGYACRARLPVIPGDVPRPETRPSGCAFHPRCDIGRDETRCQIETPTLEMLNRNQRCACWKAGAK